MLCLFDNKTQIKSLNSRLSIIKFIPKRLKRFPLPQTGYRQ